MLVSTSAMNQRLLAKCSALILALIAVLAGSTTQLACKSLNKDPQTMHKTDRADLLNQHINGVAIVLSITGSAENPGLRSVDLHVLPTPREPHATWPNGQPVSADALINASTAKAIIKLLDTQGLLDTMNTYYSNRSASPKTKPISNAVPYSEKRSEKPLPCSVRVTYFDDDWHIYFEKDLDCKSMSSLLSAVEPALDTATGRSTIASLRSALAASEK